MDRTNIYTGDVGGRILGGVLGQPGLELELGALLHKAVSANPRAQGIMNKWPQCP